MIKNGLIPVAVVDSGARVVVGPSVNDQIITQDNFKSSIRMITI